MIEALNSLKNKISLLVSRAKIKLVKDGSTAKAQSSILSKELKSGIEIFHHYGFSSLPLPECEAVIIFPGGIREHAIIISTHDKRYKPELKSGESALFDYLGKKVHLKEDGSILCDNQESQLLTWPDGKFQFKNSEHEMVAVLHEFLEYLLASKVQTAIGPQPFWPESIEKFELIKTKIESFKKG